MRDNQSKCNPSIPGAITLADTSALENFVRLQQSQEDFLAWLNASEQLAVVDRYNYRKIR